MKILALELSAARGSLAVVNGDVDPSTLLGTSLARDWANNRKHSGAFFENLQSVTKEFGAPEKIIVGLGPGSYAGTRIAISAAIGLQTASKAQLFGLPSICAMAYDGDEYCVIGDARRQSFFFARIRANELIECPVLLAEAELREKLDTLGKEMSILCSESLPQFERAVLCYPSARVLARLAQDANRSFSLPPLEPMYLREPHITVPRSKTAP
jgi:tRNA threonylcarbamoyl adenosine modification protein YeaZ